MSFPREISLCHKNNNIKCFCVGNFIRFINLTNWVLDYLITK
jgi:hypothetical protein